jgi:hypothetical protein
MKAIFAEAWVHVTLAVAPIFAIVGFLFGWGWAVVSFAALIGVPMVGFYVVA